MNPSRCHSDPDSSGEESALRKEHFSPLVSRLPCRRRDLLIVALLLIPLWVTRYLPLQDYPDWLLEGRIFSRINSPEFDFSSHYKICLVPIPNIASTVVIGALDRVVPIEIAGKIFLSLYVLLYAASIFYLFRSMPVAAHNDSAAQCSPPASRLELIPLLFTYNYFFFVGNLNYLFSLPWLFFAMGYAMRRPRELTWGQSVVLGILALVTYFSHFVAFAILALGLVSLAISRRKSPAPFVLKASCALLPAFVLFAIHLLSRTADFDVTFFHSIPHRILSFIAPDMLFFRFYPVETGVPTTVLNLLVSMLLLSLFVMLIARGLKRLRSGFGDPLSGTLLAVAGILFFFFLFAPSNVWGLVRLNQRMWLPFLIFFLLALGEPWVEKRLPAPWLLLLMLTSIIALHTLTIMRVGAPMRQSVETVLKTLPPSAKPYVITERFDPGWTGRRLKERLWNSLAPDIFPFDRVPFYHTIHRGGENVHLFDTSIVQALDPLRIDTRSTTVGTLDALVEKIKSARGEIAAEFSHVILVGSPASIPAMQRALLPDFSPIAYAPELCILASQGTIAHETRK